MPALTQTYLMRLQSMPAHPRCVSAHSPPAVAPEKQGATRKGVTRLCVFGSKKPHGPLLVLLPDGQGWKTPQTSPVSAP